MLKNAELVSASSHFAKFDYCSLAPLPKELLAFLELEYKALYEQARGVLNRVFEDQTSLADYYKLHHDEVISVSEIEDPIKLCRFEQLTDQSAWIKSILVPKLTQLIREVTGHQVIIFKDKCNLKSPNGGAFSPHQDIPAYLTFGPKYHITAAVFLDSADEENGALQMANNYREIESDDIRMIETNVGALPFFPVYEGGEKNGEIKPHIAAQFDWNQVFVEKGGIVLFNSYIPHCSLINSSDRMRRAFFFTFNLIQEGNHYAHYYQNKRKDYLNPTFHVATPTAHSGMSKKDCLSL